MASTKKTRPKKPSGYICQFCGQRSPAREWKKNKDVCPKCGKKYDYVMAMDCEEDP